MKEHLNANKSVDFEKEGIGKSKLNKYIKIVPMISLIIACIIILISFYLFINEEGKVKRKDDKDKEKEKKDDEKKEEEEKKKKKKKIYVKLEKMTNAFHVMELNVPPVIINMN